MSPGQLTDQWHTPEKLDELNCFRRIVSWRCGSYATFRTRRRFWDALIMCRSLNFCTTHRIGQFSD